MNSFYADIEWRIDNFSNEIALTCELNAIIIHFIDCKFHLIFMCMHSLHWWKYAHLLKLFTFLCWKLAVSSWVYEIPYWNYQKRRFSLPHNSKFEVKSSVYLHANLCCHPPCFTHIDHSSVQSSYPEFNFHPPALCAVCNVHQISCTCGPR